MVRYILASSYGSSNVFLDVLLIMCSNLQILSNLSTEITEPQMGMVTSLIFEKYDLRLNFCTIPMSMESASTVYIYSAVMRCNSFTPDCLEKTLPLGF
jgi:hypothetical protein